jgi:hypothetical protein
MDNTQSSLSPATVDKEIAGLSGDDLKLYNIFLRNHTEALKAEGFESLTQEQQPIIKTNTFLLFLAVKELGLVEKTLSEYKEIWEFGEKGEEQEEWSSWGPR